MLFLKSHIEKEFPIKRGSEGYSIHTQSLLVYEEQILKQWCGFKPGACGEHCVHIKSKNIPGATAAEVVVANRKRKVTKNSTVTHDIEEEMF